MVGDVVKDQNSLTCKIKEPKAESKKYLQSLHLLATYFLRNIGIFSKQEDHEGPISLTRVLSNKGRQSYVPTCDPWGGASFDPRGIK